jgi:hypothetical protein
VSGATAAGGNVENLLVSFAGTPSGSATGIAFQGNNSHCNNLMAYNAVNGFEWENGVSAHCNNLYTWNLTGRHTIDDSFPELYISNARFGLNGSGDQATSISFWGITGTNPNGIICTNCQYNLGSQSPDYFIDYYNVASYIDGIITLDDSVVDMSLGNGVAIIHSDATMPPFRLNVANTTINAPTLPMFDIGASVMTEDNFHDDFLFVSSFTLPAVQYDALNLANLYISGTLTVDGAVNSIASVSNVEVGGAVVVQGGAWGYLNIVGLSSKTSITNTATGNVSVMTGVGTKTPNLTASSGTIDDAALGQTTPLTNLAMAPAITISGAFGAANTGFYDVSSLAGDSTISTALLLTQGYTQPINAIRCTSSVSAPTIGVSSPDAVNCLSIDMTLSGSWEGSGSVLALNQTIDNAGGSQVNGNAYWPEALFSQTIKVNLGGTSGSGNGIGDFYGLGIQELGKTPASGNAYLHSVEGLEIDYGLQANVFSQHKVGLTLALWNGDVGCTNVYSECAGIWITSIQSGASVNQAILVGGSDQQWPLTTTSSLMAAVVPSASTIATGIDLASGGNLTISGCMLEGNNLCVGAGHSTATLGVTNGANFFITSYSTVDNTTSLGNFAEFAGGGGGIANANYPAFVASHAGSPVEIEAVGSDTNIALGLNGKGTGEIVFGSLARLKGFAVASLPTGAAGDIAYVTDQLTSCPSFGGTFTGGGSVACLAFRNTSGWVGG